MRILFTLDYELFLGRRCGSVEHCLLRPMSLYRQIAAEFGVRFTLFVDAAYLLALRRESRSHAPLQQEFRRIAVDLQRLAAEGHDIQLHLHPQWWFSIYDGRQWQLDTKHYKLADVEPKLLDKNFRNSKLLLEEVVGKPVCAFRAGGFSAQPTPLLARLLRENTLRLDSSVCPATAYASPCQHYDYTTAPDGDFYRFEDDICREEAGGRFCEVPITMCRVGPAFHWRLAFSKVATKLFHSPKHRTLGDGLSIPATSESIRQRLFLSVRTPATVDGMKIDFLVPAIRSALRQGREYMCVLGHPKLATPYSLSRFPAVCRFLREQGIGSCTFTDLSRDVLL